jgi:hypothetical protein
VQAGLSTPVQGPHLSKEAKEAVVFKKLLCLVMSISESDIGGSD